MLHYHIQMLLDHLSPGSSALLFDLVFRLFKGVQNRSKQAPLPAVVIQANGTFAAIMSGFAGSILLQALLLAAVHTPAECTLLRFVQHCQLPLSQGQIPVLISHRCAAGVA